MITFLILWRWYTLVMVITLLTYSYLFLTVGLIAFFLKKSKEARWGTKKNTLWWGLFGLIFNLYSFSWLYAAYPLLWLEKGFLQIIGIFLLHVIVSLVSAIPFIIVGYSFNIPATKHLKPAVFALSLIIAEIVRSIVLSILFYGDKTTIDLHFITGTIGLSLSVTPFVEFAYFGGTFALTFILSYLVYSFGSKEHFKIFWKHGVGLVILLLLIHFFVPVHGPAGPLTIAIITTDFKDVDKENKDVESKKNNRKLHEMTLSLASSTPNIIVYPEDARYLGPLAKKDRVELSNLFSDSLFIDGETAEISGKLSNLSLFYTTKDQKVLGRGKSFLFPFNEYLPYIFTKVFSLFLPSKGLDAYKQAHTYTPVDSGKTILFGGNRIGSLICSEIISFKAIQDLKNESPDIVFFQSRLNVFHNNPWFMMHLYLLSRVGAAQLRTPFITSTNRAPSLIISPYGRILSAIPTGFSTSTFILNK